MRFSILCASILLFVLFTAHADILHVPAQYPTIQAAVDSAVYGDEIQVAPGLYEENVYIDSLNGVTLTGSGFLEPDVCTIDGRNVFRGIEMYNSSHCIIQGFEIRNCWDECIVVRNCYKVSILKNYLHDCNDPVGCGLEIQQCFGVDVYFNIIANNRYANIYIDADWPMPYSRYIDIINNTLVNCYIYDGFMVCWSDSDFVFVNNITAFNNERGVFYWPRVTPTNSLLDYNCNYGNRMAWYNCIPGDSNIYVDPLFVGGTGAEAYFLLENSPCIDTGDPTRMDPDSTRSDIGALYYDQTPQGELEIQLFPLNPPIIIPAGGGWVRFGVQVTSTRINTQFDLWFIVYVPNGQVLDPFTLYQNLTIFPNDTLYRELRFYVPSRAPAGFYRVEGLVGDHPYDIEDRDSFMFVKAASGHPDEEYLGDWQLIGWEENEPIKAEKNYELTGLSLSASPNPFNNSTRISFTIPQEGFVSVKAFDLQGREAADILAGNQPAGIGEVEWNAENLPSGIYFVRIETVSKSLIQRVLLIK